MYKKGDKLRLTRWVGNVPKWVEGVALTDSTPIGLTGHFPPYGEFAVSLDAVEKIQEAGMELKQNDIVRLTYTYGNHGVGTTGVVVRDYTPGSSEYTAVRFLGSTGLSNPPVNYLQRVQGDWHNLATYPGAVAEGQTLIRPTRNLESAGPLYARTTYLKNAVYTFKAFRPVDGRASTDVALGAAHDGNHAWTRSNFEVFVEKGVQPNADDRARAMSFDAALMFARKLNAETGNEGRYRVRQRSWDKQGLYAAIEVQGRARPLYIASECEAELRAVDAAKTPLDVFIEKGSSYFRFRLPDGNFLQAPDGDVMWWTREEIKRQKGGIVERNGRKYRLCARETTTVTGNPFNENAGATRIVVLGS